MPTPEALSTVRDGARIAGALPYIEVELDKMKAAVERRVFAALRDGTLSPDTALSAWQELNAYSLLQRRLRQQVAIATSVGKNVSPEMDLG